MCTLETKHESPPYLALAEQLQVDEEQIVRAAIYNLAHIAMSRRKYRSDILQLLKNYAADETKTPEQRGYAEGKINAIQHKN